MNNIFVESYPFNSTFFQLQIRPTSDFHTITSYLCNTKSFDNQLTV